MSLRVSFLKSMWHLAEITKHSELIYMLMLGHNLNRKKRGEETDESLFVPSEGTTGVLDDDWERKLWEKFSEEPDGQLHTQSAEKATP